MVTEETSDGNEKLATVEPVVNILKAALLATALELSILLQMPYVAFDGFPFNNRDIAFVIDGRRY